MCGLNYDLRWSDDLDEKFISDFLLVQNTVFHNGTRAEFERQFERNIYGWSVLVVVYSDGRPVAARALWRNDVGGREAYQPGSSCVIPEYRGRGIFTEMTERAIRLLPEESLIYNFPNDNSYSAYMKMGWHLVRKYKARPYLSYSAFLIEHPVRIDGQYAQCWLMVKKVYHTCIGGHYFMIKPDRRPLCYHILAETERSVAEKFPKRCGLLFYLSSRPAWYDGRLGVTRLVSINQGDTRIPTWKIDCI